MTSVPFEGDGSEADEPSMLMSFMECGRVEILSTINLSGPMGRDNKLGDGVAFEPDTHREPDSVLSTTQSERSENNY